MHYKTIEKRGEQTLIEKRSEFIGHACPVATEEEAISFIAEIRKKHSGATHNVFAYKVRDNNICRFSDDGEPQGTAGVPTLNVIEKQNLTNCVIVVTRYFGGTLLGAGGLVRAYGSAASGAVAAAKVIEMAICKKISIKCDYNQYGKIQGTVIEKGGMVTDTLFTDVVEILANIRPQDVGPLQKVLTEQSAGTINIKEIGEEWLKVKESKND